MLSRLYTIEQGRRRSKVGLGQQASSAILPNHEILEFTLRSRSPTVHSPLPLALVSWKPASVDRGYIQSEGDEMCRLIRNTHNDGALSLKKYILMLRRRSACITPREHGRDNVDEQLTESVVRF